ncbi:putative anti-sigma factor antagonist (Partial match) [Frankia sp. AiPs1]
MVETSCAVSAGSRRGQAVRLVGRVDVRSAGTLRCLLHAVIDGGTGPLRVDVAGLELEDRSALGVLLGGARRARAAGRSMVLVDVPGALVRMVVADRLGRVLRFEEPEEMVHVGHA